MRVAFFSPLNPQRSGISDYSEELLPHLAQGADITLFVDGFQPTNAELARQFTIVNYHRDPSFLRRLDEFDAVLYHMGNDHRYHAGIFDAAQKHPGIIVFHDFALQDFFLGLSRQRRDTNVYLDEVEACHGATTRSRSAQALADGVPPPGHDQPTEFPLNCRIAREAEGIIVHSDWSRTRFRRIAPTVPIKRIPMPVKPSPLMATANNDDSKSRRIELASFGLIIPGKGLEQILRSLAGLKQDHNFHFTLVGSENPYFDVRSLIKLYDMGDHVTITGHVSLDEFERYIAATDVAINLRERTVGETSASLCRIMAAGVPVIVSNVGSFAELPDDAVVKIDNDAFGDRMLQAFLRKLMDDSQLRKRIGANALTYIENEHDIRLSAGQYLEFMGEIIEGRTRRQLISNVSTELKEIGVESSDQMLMSVAQEIATLAPAATFSGNGNQIKSSLLLTASSKQSTESSNNKSDHPGRLEKIPNIDYKRAAIDYPKKLDAERHHYLFTKPFYNLANKPTKHLGDGMDAETFRHFCDFANMAVALALPAGSRILDVGCGSGWLSEYLARLGYDVTGIDISPHLIDIAEKRIAGVGYDVDHETPISCRFQVHDIETEALSETFDAVVCYDSLHHFEDERSVIRHLSSMTSYGGVVFIMEGDRPPTGSATEDELVEVMQRYETLESPFSRTYLRELLNDNGLSVIGDYVSVNGLYEREAFELNEVRFEPPEVNYLLCKKVVKTSGPASSVPDSRTPNELSATITAQGWLQSATRDSVIEFDVTIQNSGKALWLVGPAERRGSVMLGIRLTDNRQRVVFERHGTPPLPRMLASGERAKVILNLRVPAIAGNYTLTLDMVAQHVCWFESNGSKPLVLSLLVE